MIRKLMAMLLLVVVVSLVVFFINNNGGSGDDRGHILPCDTAEVKTSRPVVRIYMENSGSMNGYVTTNSQFKNALGHLITKADGFYADTQVNFINQGIYHTPMCDDLDNFVLNLNPVSMQVGNTSSTDINKIFKMILDRTSRDTVSVLVSDCMYDVDNVDNQLAAAASSTTGTFMKAIRRAHDAKEEFAVIIMQCASEFSGNYYEGNTAIPCNGERPYYVIVMGNLKQVMDFNNHMELQNTSTGLPGMTHKYMLSSESTWTLDNTTARTFTRDFTNARKIQPEEDRLNIRKITTNHDQVNLKLGVALGVSNLFADRTYLIDKNNYKVEPSTVSIADIGEQVSFPDYDVFEKPFSLQLVTEGQSFVPQVTITLLNQIPEWVKTCSYTKRSGALPPSHQSYALYEMVEGIYGAFYNSMTGKSKDLFRLQFRIGGYE